MTTNRLTKSAAVLMMLATGVIATGCAKDNSNESALSNLKFQETETSKLDKGMVNQPESSYWFPKDFLAWSFDKDPDAKFNVSSVPLAKRVDKKELPTSNDSQDENMNVVALSIMNDSTSGNAPHGINTFDANVFSYWQYVDQMVYWGGSSGEGIIVPPSADVIDAAHKNGVPVLGTVFFPQLAHGGKIEWLDEFLVKDADGNFPAVDKMIEVADAYGFDGWFINQETDNEVESFDDVKDGKEEKKEKKDDENGLSKKHADLMRELIAQYEAKAEDRLDLMWYDSMTVDGEMDWQNALTDKNKDYLVDADMNPLADTMFLNFWWNTDKFAKDKLLKKSNEKAKKENIDPYSLYAGIDVQENGFATPVKWDLFMDDKGTPYTSLGLYVPSWTFHSSETADEFQEKEGIFWVNGKQDPRDSTLPKGEEWPGISTFAVEQTAITTVPFKTNFSLGNGYNYFINGEKVSAMNWNNRSMQDIMPTYRWEFDHGKGNELTPSMDYTDAYNAGNSVKLRGKMAKGETTHMNLYRSEIEIPEGATFTSTAKATEETSLDLVLTLGDDKEETIKADKKIGDEWTTVTYDMKNVVGKTIKEMAYDITSDKESHDYELKLGQLAILPKEEKVDMAVKDLVIEDTVFDEEETNFTGVRMSWSEAGDEKVDYYEIYRINGDDSRSFLGATPTTNHYINALERNDDTNKTEFEVIPVDVYGRRGTASEKVAMEWPDNSIPKASFKASRTLIAPGDEVTFTNTSSQNAESITWDFVGGTPEKSDQDSAVVKYEKEGTYEVKLTAKNESGENIAEEKNFITVTKDAKGELPKLSEGATAEASSFVNDGEAPEFALDGKLDTKWCAVGPAPHDITVDLGQVDTVSEVKMSHAEAGGESPDMNTKAYKIEVSEDGKEYKQVTRVINNSAGETTDTFAPVEARYVKITLDKPTQGADSAARIYEVSVYGMKK